MTQINRYKKKKMNQKTKIKRQSRKCETLTCKKIVHIINDDTYNNLSMINIYIYTQSLMI